MPNRPISFFAPASVGDELLRAEGFTDIRDVAAAGGFSFPGVVARGELNELRQEMKG
jgi:hypothetical protein